MAANAEWIASLRARLDRYYAAEEAILANQEYEMPDGRKLKRASLKDVTATIKRLEGQLAGATGVSLGRIRRGVPMPSNGQCFR